MSGWRPRRRLRLAHKAVAAERWRPAKELMQPPTPSPTQHELQVRAYTEGMRAGLGFALIELEGLR